MREVGVQAANDTNNAQDRSNLQAEMDAMLTEIDRIAGTTTWAGASLMADATDTTDFSFQVGAATGTQNQITVNIAGMNGDALSLSTTGASDLDVTDGGTPGDAPANALASITLIDDAIKTVNIQRSELGAVSNRFSHTVNNLTNISSNLSAAKGGIEDADFALETTNLAKTRSCSKRPPRCWPKPTHPSRTFSACCKAKRNAKLRCKTIKKRQVRSTRACLVFRYFLGNL